MWQLTALCVFDIAEQCACRGDGCSEMRIQSRQGSRFGIVFEVLPSRWFRQSQSGWLRAARSSAAVRCTRFGQQISAGANRQFPSQGHVIADLGHYEAAATHVEPGEPLFGFAHRDGQNRVRPAEHRAVIRLRGCPGSQHARLRATGPLVVAGSPTCSAMATERPALTRRAR